MDEKELYLCWKCQLASESINKVVDEKESKYWCDNCFYSHFVIKEVDDGQENAESNQEDQKSGDRA